MWHHRIEPIVWQFFVEVCRREPESIWDYRRIMRRLGVRMKLMRGPARLAGPHSRRGVIYIPRGRGRSPHLHAWLLHELSELATYYEGIPPYRCPSSTEWDRHLVARMVELRHQKPDRRS